MCSMPIYLEVDSKDIPLIYFLKNINCVETNIFSHFIFEFRDICDN